MSTIQLVPFAQKVIASLSSENQAKLLNLINGNDKSATFKSLINPTYKITTEDLGTDYITLETKAGTFTGYLVYTLSYCVVFSFLRNTQNINIIKVNPTALTFEIINEELSILEIRAILEHLALAESAGLKREIVEELPEEDIDPNIIYMVLDDNASGDNVYNEYMYIGNAWELIGSTAVAETGNTIAWSNIDLTSGTASKTPTEAEWLLMTDDESDCKLLLTLTTNEVIRLERVDLTSSVVLFSALSHEVNYFAMFMESDNVLSSVITAVDTTIQANPTLAGTEAELTSLQVGATKYKIDKPIHFIKLASDTLTEALRNEILSDDYFVILEYSGSYYYEKTYTTSPLLYKEFENIINMKQWGSLNYDSYVEYTLKLFTIRYDTTTISITTRNYDTIDSTGKNVNNTLINSKTSSSTNATAGQVLTADGSGGTGWALTEKLGYLTTAPSQDNTSGVLQIVVLSSEPATKYNGYLYIITGA